MGRRMRCGSGKLSRKSGARPRVYVCDGTYPERAPSIALNGFKPAAGAGSAALGSTFVRDAPHNERTFPLHIPGF